MCKYNLELAKAICQELGIKWNDNATIPTVAGESIKIKDLQPSDIFVISPYEDEKETV